jgi:aminoglycoside 6-adenylyltransferase
MFPLGKHLSADPVIQRLIDWARRRDSIRCLLLTSSRANPYAPVDALSDYDVLLGVTDVRAYHTDRSYLNELGEVLVVYHDPLRIEAGFERFADITQYADGTKIDYTFYPTDYFQWLAAQPALPEDLNLGYQVLVDKDGLASGLQRPTHRAYIPTPPGEAEYLTVIEEFFHEATYVAKNLWRGELIFWKHCLDEMMKGQMLRRMLEWRMEIEHGWSVKTGVHGRGLQARTRPELWAALEATYTGADVEENWAALFETIALFRQVAQEVGEALGYAYPDKLERRVAAYLQWVQELPSADPIIINEKGTTDDRPDP